MTENCGCGLDLIFPQGSNAGLVIQNGLYGVCNTNASTQEKAVDIEGFTSENLVEGTCIAVRFAYMQLYDGIPKLNVSGTGAKNIQTRAGTNAGKGEWYTGQIVEFVFYNNAWVIVDGFHATTGYYGKTKLTNDFSVIDMNSAATGQMVTALAGFVAQGWLWDGKEHSPTVLLNTMTPDGGDWDPYTDQLDTATIHYTDFGSVVNSNPYYMRMLKVTFGDRVFFKGLNYNRPFEEISIYYDEDYTDARITIGTSQTEFICHPPYADLTFKVELYSGYGDAGLVTYPLLKECFGGGGSLPTPSAAKNGYSLVVNPVPLTAVPQQTVQVVGEEALLTNVDTSLFADGASFVATVDGMEFRGKMQDSGGNILSVFGVFVIVLLNDGETVIFEAADGSHTVSLSVDSATQFEWGLRQMTMEVIFDPETRNSDRTFVEVFNAMTNGTRVYTVVNDGDYTFESTAMFFRLGDVLSVSFLMDENRSLVAYANSIDGYLYFGT